MKVFIKDKRLVISKKINSPAERIWEIITDTCLWKKWGPSVSGVSSDNRYISEGSKGLIKIYPGFYLRYEITSFKYGQYWGWKVEGVNATGHFLFPLNDKKTVLAFDMPVFTPFYLLVCAVALGRIKKIAEDKSISGC